MSNNSDTDSYPFSKQMSGADLPTALREGDPQRVLALIEAGADVHYKRDYGYDALIDAVHWRDISRDPRLLELLTLLVAKGVDLCGVTPYEVSGLRALSWIGRFDAVRLLLEAGADKSQLGWTPLIEAVVLGSLADVKNVLESGAALEERDWWSRTAWLIALLIGDIAKAKLLRAHGADPNARGRRGRPPLFYAIDGHHPDMLRWLLEEGADVHQSDDLDRTALMEAVENNDLECVEILLNAGADVEKNANGTALSRAKTREIVLRLLDAGADPAHLSYRGYNAMLKCPPEWKDPLATVSSEDFERAFTRSFGTSNPERMTHPFWESMIRCGADAYSARLRFEKQPFDLLGEPVWCAQRDGQSLTMLPDGRIVEIGGEYEDFYHPDFCIYNDVFVHERDQSIRIFGYPESVFPPTDFHTATLIGDGIYVIGSLGYQGTRRYGETPVYRLDIRTFQMDRLDTHGEVPGWIYGHQAVAIGQNGIRVWGGTVVVTRNDNKESHHQNLNSFVLDLDRLLWQCE